MRKSGEKTVMSGARNAKTVVLRELAQPAAMGRADNDGTADNQIRRAASITVRPARGAAGKWRATVGGAYETERIHPQHRARDWRGLVGARCARAVQLAVARFVAPKGARGAAQPKIRGFRYGDSGTHRNPNQPPGDGDGHGGLRPPLQSKCAGRSGFVAPAAQWLRSRPAIFRLCRFLWYAPARERGLERNSARQSDRADQDLGARCGFGAGGPGPFSPGTGSRPHRRLPDALPDRSGLDRALPRGGGRA